MRKLSQSIGIFRMLCDSRHLPRRLQFQHIQKETQNKKYGTVLDIGGGRSPYKRIINCSNFITTDIENRRGETSVVIADANEHLPFEDKSVDLIICTEVIEHLHTPFNAFCEMHRILKDDGAVLLTAPMVWEHHEEPVDFYRYTQYGVGHLSKKAGFNSVLIKQSNGHWYTVVALILSRMRPRLFLPVVFLLNILGRFIYCIEPRKNLPLGIHAVLRK